MVCHNQNQDSLPKVRVTQKSKTQYDNLCPMQDSGSLAVFKVTARDQGHHKGPSGAFVTYCNISCSYLSLKLYAVIPHLNRLAKTDEGSQYMFLCRINKNYP